MKKIIFSLIVTLGISDSAMAQFTDSAHIAVQSAQFIAVAAREVTKMADIAKQVQMMVQNLEKNPMAVTPQNLAFLTQNESKLMAAGKSVGNSMSQISDRYDTSIKNPQGNYSDKYRAWTGASTDALSASMLNAGLHRENFANDSDALDALVRKNQASSGNLGALQTLGEINTAQLQESLKLRDLISAQQIAVTTHMAAQVTKDQAAVDNNDSIQKGFEATKPKELPKLDTSTQTYKKFDFYSK